MIIVPLLFCFFALFAVDNYLKIRYEMIHVEDAMKAAELSKEFDDYLDKVEMLVVTSAEGVEYLVDQGADHDTIHKYLEIQSADRSNVVMEDTDGLYGYIDGEYNDGYNWTPYEGYDPTQRIWYKEAVDADGNIVMVEPYVDARTKALIVTVTKALESGTDVVAADIDLSGFQRLTNTLADNYNDHDIMVMDAKGNVIACSVKGEAGLNYQTDDKQSRRDFYASWQKSNQSYFVTTIEGEKYLISLQDIKYGWTAFTITNVNILFKTLGHFAILSVIVIALLTIFIIALIILMAGRLIKAQDDYESLEAMANIYITLYKIDMEEDSFEQLFCHEYKVAAVVGEKRTEAARIIWDAMREVTEQRNLEEVLEFTDLKTLNERMKGKETISIEFLNYEHLWFRGRFVAVERNKDGSLKTALWAVEMIDDEKRYRDRLQYLAETDQLTGINNRGSGEKKIRKLMRVGKGGMFILFDADKFKSINDTFGHDAGDCVLVAIADTMKHSFRERDIVMRLGGDEFAVFAPGVLGKEDGDPIIRRFIEAIEKINLEEIKGRQISISLGVAFYQPDDTFSFENLYKRADDCTYESKKIPGCAVTYFTKWYE